DVIQTPPDIIKAVGHSVTLQCSHNIEAYDQILWYQQRIMGMQLIGYMSYETTQMESGYDQIKLEGSARPGKTCKMVILELSPSRSATYYCAASSHGAVLFEIIKP
uniref:Immunoglobulin domain-containing protein n=1 Tax=Hippocampus comes TaxID=109280 RepID=A0A3Q2XT02_HIPCM